MLIFLRLGMTSFGGPFAHLGYFRTEFVERRRMLRGSMTVQATLRGVNAAVVGVLLAALFSTMWLGSVVVPADFGLVLACFLLLATWNVSPWLVVLAGAAAAEGLAALGVPL